MLIRKACSGDFEEISEIYENARIFMAEHGNPTQWGSHYPSEDSVLQDIRDGCCHVCVEKDQIAAVFYYRLGPDPTYKKICAGNWINSRPYGVVHRIAAAGTIRGAASFCLNWAYEQCGNLKIDTHENNYIMQNLLAKLEFTRCGIIYTDDGSPRIAYQKEKSEI